MTTSDIQRGLALTHSIEQKDAWLTRNWEALRQREGMTGEEAFEAATDRYIAVLGEYRGLVDARDEITERLSNG